MTPSPRLPFSALRSLLPATLLCTLLAAVASASGDPVQDAAIRQHRMGNLVITAAPGTPVEVEQVQHEFWFGAALANQAFDGGMPAADAARYKEVFLANFNSAVCENALKWLSMEQQREKVEYATVDAMLAWTDQHSIPLRGHNIYWGSPQWIQPWMQRLNDAALRAALQARGKDIGRRYRGRFAEYDFNNEMIHGNFYADRLGAGITREMADWVLAEDPAAKLYVNDYDILTGKRLADYVAHIRKLLASGVPIQGIGVQGHLHGDSFDPADVRAALDKLAQFHLPIRVTEFNFPGQRSKFLQRPKLAITPKEEQAKARAIVEYYRTCFAHPSVTGILMWGFWEGANWIPQSSLFKKDWSPTPAALAYRDLIYREWWTRWSGVVGADGRLEVPAFFGTHRVSVGGKVSTVVLPKGTGTATVASP
ncbi:MAG: endo-1,4-beta-xylanase [Opitutaceae bacterium]|nr:endo-1,4-beta-xylanase [Opitutaceae bacterium]